MTTWVSSMKLRDYIAGLTVATLDTDGVVPALVDDRLKRLGGIETTRSDSAPNLSGPYIAYDWRTWDGSATLEQTGIIDFGPELNMTVAETTSGEGIDWQEAEVTATGLNIDWSGLGGAPDNEPLTVVAAFTEFAGQLDVDPEHEALFEMDGDVLFSARAYVYQTLDNGIEISWLVHDTSSEISAHEGTQNVDQAVWRSVVTMTLDLPAGTQSGLWTNGAAVTHTLSKTGDYATTPPTFPNSTAPVITDFHALLARSIPSVASGAPATGAYGLAFYRGYPSVNDLANLQEAWGL